MKIFVNGDNTSADENQRSLSFAVKSPNVHCITLGLDSAEQVDDAVDRVMRIIYCSANSLLLLSMSSG